MAGATADRFMIRQAQPEELSRLTEIELDAFATLAEALGDSRNARALPEAVLRESLQDDLLFIAADSQNQPIGFLAAAERDQTLYIVELDVAVAWQRRGIGKNLLAVAIETARARRLCGVTLTTDRFVPFNAPFYARLGFKEIAADDVLPQLRQRLQHEMSVSTARDRRVAMILHFA